MVVCVWARGAGSLASTEPRSFERGDQRAVVAIAGANSLQRSRALSSAEIRAGVRDNRHRIRASTEPRSFERGDRQRLAIARAVLLASTEPRSFERGDSYSAHNYTRRWGASTEPRSFERGDRHPLEGVFSRR